MTDIGLAFTIGAIIAFALSAALAGWLVWQLRLGNALIHDWLTDLNDD
jgi:hypothetical protein